MKFVSNYLPPDNQASVSPKPQEGIMSRSVKLLSNSIARRAASWMASFLAVASVSLLGRSGAAAASPSGSQEQHPMFSVDQGAEIQVNYVQLGYKNGEDWPPPRPE